MTEKRFQIIDDDLFDNENIEVLMVDFEVYGVPRIVDVLNELNDENEQLKSDINLLTDQYNNIFEKNEQLKSDIKLHIDDSEKYRGLSIKFDNQNKELITENALLEKENEQLKQTNQRLNDELQECMGKLALKR